MTFISIFFAYIEMQTIIIRFAFFFLIWCDSKDTYTHTRSETHTVTSWSQSNIRQCLTLEIGSTGKNLWLTKSTRKCSCCCFCWGANASVFASSRLRFSPNDIVGNFIPIWFSVRGDRLKPFAISECSALKKFTINY